jgi:hypothetical protein
MLGKLFARLLTKIFTTRYERRASRRSMPRPGVTSRLGIELLEAREVPAQMVWLGMEDSNFSNVDNWLQDSSPAERLPEAGDDLLFSGHMTQTECVGLVGDPAGAYNSVTFQSAAPAVYLGGDVVTGGLYLYDGEIRNAASGQDITVTGELNWTAGKLNPTTYTGFLNLVGATGLIDPGEGNTLVSGSDLNFEKSGAVGSSVTIKPGTLELRNGAGITVRDLCTMTILAQNPAGQAANVLIDGHQHTASTKRAFILRSGARAEVKGPGSATLQNREVINDGGLVWLRWQATLRALSSDPVGTPIYPFVQNSAGMVSIDYGCQIQASHEGFYADSGTILINGNPNWQQPGADLASAKLTGKFWNDGAVIRFTGPHWRFEVFGDVYWSGGRFQPRVDVADVPTANADMWIIQGRLTIPEGSTAKILPDLVNYTSPNPLPAGLRREILVATQGITGGPVPVEKFLETDAAMKIDPVTPDPNLPKREWWLVPA